MDWCYWFLQKWLFPWSFITKYIDLEMLPRHSRSLHVNYLETLFEWAQNNFSKLCDEMTLRLMSSFSSSTEYSDKLSVEQRIWESDNDFWWNVSHKPPIKPTLADMPLQWKPQQILQYNIITSWQTYRLIMLAHRDAESLIWRTFTRMCLYFMQKNLCTTYVSE